MNVTFLVGFLFTLAQLRLVNNQWLNWHELAQINMYVHES